MRRHAHATETKVRHGADNLEYNGKTYSFDEAYDLVDSKAAGDEYDDKGVGKSSGRF